MRQYEVIMRPAESILCMLYNKKVLENKEMILYDVSQMDNKLIEDIIDGLGFQNMLNCYSYYGILEEYNRFIDASILLPFPATLSDLKINDIISFKKYGYFRRRIAMYKSHMDLEISTDNIRIIKSARKNKYISYDEMPGEIKDKIMQELSMSYVDTDNTERINLHFKNLFARKGLDMSINGMFQMLKGGGIDKIRRITCPRIKRTDRILLSDDQLFDICYDTLYTYKISSRSEFYNLLMHHIYRAQDQELKRGNMLEKEDMLAYIPYIDDNYSQAEIDMLVDTLSERAREFIKLRLDGLCMSLAIKKAFKKKHRQEYKRLRALFL